MKIYTKTGDEGSTGLYGGERVSKDHFRIHTYGTLDELNASIGYVISALRSHGFASPAAGLKLSGRLVRVQGELFMLGAELATPRNRETKSKLVEDTDIALLESEIDEMETALQPLKNFILPGGSMEGASLHVARTICRRGERDLISLNRAEPVRGQVLRYINRLSDYLFVAARWINHESKIEDTPWLG